MPAKKKTLKKPKKNTHGGRREGAGRPATGKVATAVKYIRCSETASEAIDDHIEALNCNREAAGLKPISLSRWGTEAMLKAAKRKDLIAK